MAQLVSYNFSIVENPLSDGGNFTTLADTFFTQQLQTVSGNLCEPSVNNSTVGALYSGLAWPADQYSELTIATIGGGTQKFYLMVRQGAFNSGTQYIFTLNPNGGQVYTLAKIINNVSTNLVPNTATTIMVGDIWRLSVTGAVITISRNGAVVNTITDSSIISGSPAFGLQSTTLVTRCQINLWAGGSAPAPDSGGLGTGTLMGGAIIDLDQDGFPIAESQIGTLL